MNNLTPGRAMFEVMSRYEQLLEESVAPLFEQTRDLTRALTETIGPLLLIAEGEIDRDEFDVEGYCADVRRWLLDIKGLESRLEGMIRTLKNEDDDD